MQQGFVRNPIIRQRSCVNEIYLSRKKSAQVYIARIEKLLDDAHTEILLHASGMAIPRLLEIVNKVSPLFTKISVETSSVEVIDDSISGCLFRQIPGLHALLTKIP